jgi:hypothetical protein
MMMTCRNAVRNDVCNDCACGNAIVSTDLFPGARNTAILTSALYFPSFLYFLYFLYFSRHRFKRP